MTDNQRSLRLVRCLPGAVAVRSGLRVTRRLPGRLLCGQLVRRLELEGGVRREELLGWQHLFEQNRGGVVCALLYKSFSVCFAMCDAVL